MTGGQENRREVGRETRGDYGAGAGASAHVPAVIQRGIPFAFLSMLERAIGEQLLLQLLREGSRSRHPWFVIRKVHRKLGACHFSFFCPFFFLFSFLFFVSTQGKAPFAR